MSWKDKYLERAEALQHEEWSREDRRDLRVLLFGSALHRAIGKVLLNNSNAQDHLMSANLGTQEGIIRATKIQGEVAGSFKFLEYLLDLAETEEDKENGKRP